MTIARPSNELDMNEINFLLDMNEETANSKKRSFDDFEKVSQPLEPFQQLVLDQALRIIDPSGSAACAIDDEDFPGQDMSNSAIIFDKGDDALLSDPENAHAAKDGAAPGSFYDTLRRNLSKQAPPSSRELKATPQPDPTANGDDLFFSQMMGFPDVSVVKEEEHPSAIPFKTRHSLRGASHADTVNRHNHHHHNNHTKTRPCCSRPDNNHIKMEFDQFEPVFDYFSSDTEVESTTSRDNSPESRPYSARRLADMGRTSARVHGPSHKRRKTNSSQQPALLSSLGTRICKDSELPPRFSVASDLRITNSSIAKLAKSELMSVVEHPPLEVRTRTKKEKRLFSCTVELHSQQRTPAGTQIGVKLVYATNTEEVVDILDGTALRSVEWDDKNKCVIAFEDMNIRVASPKHEEREFCLRIELNNVDGARPVFSRPFYAFSHKSVLQRRKEVDLRAISGKAASSMGGTRLHVVGTPFVKSHRLQVIFRARARDLQACPSLSHLTKNVTEKDDWVSVHAENIEWYSESVLFFDTPVDFRDVTSDLLTFVQVTNDSRHFSKPLPFVFEV